MPFFFVSKPDVAVLAPNILTLYLGLILKFVESSVIWKCDKYAQKLKNQEACKFFHSRKKMFKSGNFHIQKKSVNDINGKNCLTHRWVWRSVHF